MSSLLEAVRNQDKNLAEQFMKGDTWSTLEHLIGAHSGNEWVIGPDIWDNFHIFFFLFIVADASKILRRQLVAEMIGHVTTARTLTAAIRRPVKSAACRVKKFDVNIYETYLRWEIKRKIWSWKSSNIAFVFCLFYFTTCDRWQFHYSDDSNSDVDRSWEEKWTLSIS